MGYILIAFGLVSWFSLRASLPGFQVDLVMIHSQLGWIAVILLILAADLSFRLKKQTKKLEEMIEQQKEIANILRIGIPNINKDKK